MSLLSKYSGRVFDHEVLLCCQSIGQVGGRIEGAGLEIFFPNDALPPGESSTIKVLTSTDGPTEHYGFFSVSPIFHVKCEPYREFQKEIQVTIEISRNWKLKRTSTIWCSWSAREEKKSFVQQPAGL